MVWADLFPLEFWRSIPRRRDEAAVEAGSFRKTLDVDASFGAPGSEWLSLLNLEQRKSWGRGTVPQLFCRTSGLYSLRQREGILRSGSQWCPKRNLVFTCAVISFAIKVRITQRFGSCASCTLLSATLRKRRAWVVGPMGEGAECASDL